MTGFFNWVEDIVVRIRHGRKPAPEKPVRPFPTVAAEMVGWGPTYVWMDMDLEATEQVAAAMEAAGLNIVPLELFGFGRAGWWKRVPELMALFRARAGIYAKHGLLVDLKVCNWNWGEGHSENGTMSVCDNRLGDDWFGWVLDGLAGYEGSVILQACAEWGPGSRGKACWKKAERWCNRAAEKWTGLKSWNYEARPKTAPAGHILDWHVDRVDSLGPRTRNKVVTTDTSGVLNYLGGVKGHLNNHGRLGDLVRACRRQGCGFSGYTFFDVYDARQDLAAIEVIGAAWKG